MKLFYKTNRRLMASLLAGLFFLAQGLMFPVVLSAAQQATPFNDVAPDHWALKYIVNLSARDIMSGDNNGNFRPDQPISQLEAVLLAVRCMGQDSAISEVNADADLPFEVPSWANQGVFKKELLFAVEQGLLVPSQKDFIASDFASRAWISQLMVRLIGKQSEAFTMNSTTPDFIDADEMPSWSIGYINAALKYDLISKFPDGSFKPEQLVTRAQTATLLTRAEPYLTPSANQVEGPITALSPDTIGLQVGQAIMGYTLTDDSYLFDHNDKACTWDALKLGDYANLVIDGAKIEYLAVSEPPAATITPQPQPVFEQGGTETFYKSGLVYLVSAKKRLIVLSTDGLPLAYLVSTAARISIPGIENATLYDIQDNDYVELTITNGIITQITVQ